MFILVSLSAFLLIAALLVFLNRDIRIRLYSWFAAFPGPKYRVHLEHNVMLPMQDGVKLATDVYRPKAPGKFPVILVRTPYNKTGRVQPYKQLAELLTSQGYVFIVQDVRGKYQSEGYFEPYKNEAKDGHVTLTWAGEAPWSNGKVALVGLSYSGSCAWLATRYKSPYLTTIVTIFTSQSTYSVWFDDGMPFMKGALYWLCRYSGRVEDESITQHYLEPFLWQLPVSELDVLTVDHEIPFYREYLEHLSPDSFWDSISVDQSSPDLDIPAFILGGWFDPFLRGTIEDYQRMIQAPPSSKNHQSKLIVGPWTHDPFEKFKGIHFGKHSGFSALLKEIFNWCDIWLKGNNAEEKNASKVSYFLLGKKEWRESKEWPPANITYEKCFLSLDDHLFSHKSGLLSSTLPNSIQKCRFTYNPKDPVLFRGKYLLHTHVWSIPKEDDSIFHRKDVLFFTSHALDKELIIVGPMKLVLYVSSEGLDTDFCAKICDKHPNGKVYIISSGFIRMRFRDSLQEPKLMEPGVIYKIEIFIKPTANAFKVGHQIQLQLASSDFPVHNRNVNTGESSEFSTEVKIVEQTVYTGGPYESYLLLPVLKE